MWIACLRVLVRLTALVMALAALFAVLGSLPSTAFAQSDASPAPASQTPASTAAPSHSGSPAPASQTPDGPVAPSHPEDAKRHFENGVRLFQDHNYGGALVEFDASFQLNPTAVALQNTAVCQKALFRYAEAIATLERVVREFGARLPADDCRRIAEAIRDMSGLLGTLVIRTTPADARVSINDKPIPPDVLRSPMRLATGEYVVTVEAPGYTPSEQTIAIVSQKERTLAVALELQTGTLIVRTPDALAAIAIDGVQVGYEDWRGPLPAGPHEVTVYTAKLRHRSSVVVLAGQKSELDVKLTEKEDLPPAYEPGLPLYVPPPPLEGWFGYALLSGEMTFMPTLALQDGNFFRVSTRPKSSGVLPGFAAGYRFTPLWSAEVMFQMGTRTIHGCSVPSADADCATNDFKLDLSTIRLAAGVRMMTPGRRVRLFATGRLGGASQVLTVLGTERHGGGLIGQIGGGIEANFGHLLVNAALLGTAEGAGGMGPNGQTPDSPIGSAAIEVRIGYGQW